MIRSARFSRCRRFRYLLQREWNVGKTVLFVALNPSTADEHKDDPTVRRCIGFARAWGYGRLALVNLFGYRCTKSSQLKKVEDPVGPANDRIVRAVVRLADLIVVAWGVGGALLQRDAAVLRLLTNPQCLGVTQRGFPRHPLYLPARTTPRPFPID